MNAAGPLLLAGDVGGTKTELAVFTPERGPRDPIGLREFPSAGYDSLEAMVKEFLEDFGRPVDAACLDVAGPVLGGRAHITNLKWVVDAAALARSLELDAIDLMNDLEALAWAVPTLGQADLLTLSAGEPVENGPIAVIAPGTGLGQSFLAWDGTRYRAHGSEGGHADFAPVGERQEALLAFLRGRFDRVSYERVCSGIGIPNIYDFLRDTGVAEEDPAIAARLAGARDRTPIIMKAALDPAAPSRLCTETFRTFAAILGAEAGNMALRFLATGGVFIGGGVPLHLLTALPVSPLLEAFRAKGRLSGVVARVPLHVIVRRAALLGAATYGLDRMAEGPHR